MDTLTLLVLMAGVAAVIGFILGVSDFGKSLPGIVFAVCVVGVSILVVLELGKLILGTPAELKDGIYQIRVVALLQPKAPAQADVGVLVLKEEGKKSPQYPPRFCKIPENLFAVKAPKVGDVLTIELRQSPAKRELVIK